MGRKKILDNNFKKISINVLGENVDIIERLTMNSGYKMSPLINKIIKTVCNMPDVQRRAIEQTCLKEYANINELLENTNEEFTRKKLIEDQEQLADMLWLMNGCSYKIDKKVISLNNMTRIELSNGYLIYPKEWIVTNPEEAEQCRYAIVLECKNSTIYQVPHFIYLTEYNFGECNTDDLREKIYDRCRKIWVRFSEIEELNEKNKLIPDPNNPNCYLNLKEYMKLPIINLFYVSEEGKNDEYPYGAMIVRTS